MVLIAQVIHESSSIVMSLGHYLFAVRTLPRTLRLPALPADRRLWRAGENHPWWLHTPSGPSKHLRNQDRTFASTSWSTRHLSSRSTVFTDPAGVGSGTGDPSILLDAVPRSVSVRVLFRSSGVLCFVLPNPIAPARRVPPVCEQMAAQAWLNSEIDATAAAGAEARAAQPGFARDRGVTAVADAEARAAQPGLAEARAAQPGPRGTSRGDIVAHVRVLPRGTAHNYLHV